MDSPDCHDLATLAIHIGCAPDPVTGDVVPPIHVASTYVQDRPGQLRDGYEYGRCANPTTNAFAGAIAALEGARNGFAFPSGMSAEDTLIRLLARPGDQVVHSTDVYGGTHKLLSVIKPAEGIASESVDLTDVDVAARAIRRARPQIVWVETPSNPFLTVTDIAAIAELTHEVGGLLVVDNTFATPVLQRPLDLGADAVVHSTTKYVAGHSDVVGGAFVLRDDLTLPAHVTPFFDEADAAAEAVKLQMTLGHVPSPRDTYLAHRGLKTLALRVERHCENAQRVAEYLAEHPKVASVHYPGLASDPGHGIAQRQNPRGVGGVLSFQVATEEAAIRLSTRTRLFALAASLGAPESLIEHPAIMTHSTRVGGVGGVPGTLLRLAVGLEDAGDLIADLEQALAQI
ncbi:MAG: aminotransferase class I/II-fold pyridoxal phosphate-dependent enzyme [Pauljensenia sp.]